MIYEMGEQSSPRHFDAERHSAISAHAAHGCGLPSIGMVEHWHQMYQAERMLRLAAEAECARLRALQYAGIAD